ncbi:hypothetical protein BDY19DRAFT_881332 [Irpex rosettiformis]|uniref:Uncharacterized protein n=1 Tax=Irpex rosettiformis TaxID=378272 RepID=A0ACB8UIA4_9APHY|nr:hypothetical protein BDY19DRAFT_881332 [Irpex rosettiformis]
MPSDDPEARNASGLIPSETKSLKERTVEPHESEIIQSIKELYTCKPTENTYSVYANNAVFHDPVGIAEGIESIRAQFNGLAKIFPRADLPKFRVLENPPSVSKNKILIDIDVDYYLDAKADKSTKTVNSLLTIETDASNKIIRHTEEWNHQHESDKDDGFWGMLNEQRKKLTANIVGKFVGQEPPNW